MLLTDHECCGPSTACSKCLAPIFPVQLLELCVLAQPSIKWPLGDNVTAALQVWREIALISHLSVCTTVKPEVCLCCCRSFHWDFGLQISCHQPMIIFRD